MKLMKRIAAIMLSVVMVLGMSSVVSATTTGSVTSAPVGSTVKGKITIDNAIVGQTYKIYKILELESYNNTTGSYAYKAVSSWDNFINTGEGNAYLQKDASGYVTWKTSAGTEEATKAEFAKKALAYAKTNSVTETSKKDATAATTGATITTVEFTDLALGYYLVESSTGALCSLTTTANEITIQEKNGAPTVEKKVKKNDTDFGESNTASIGDTVEFKTTITAQPGAENYVLHDTMSAGLTFNSSTVVVKKSTGGTESPLISGTDYTIVLATGTSGTTDGCTFEIIFKQTFCNTLVADDKIIVTYSATLNENASIGTTPGNTNKTHLSYGDNKNTTDVGTTTKTFEVPVFKYTNKAGSQTGLAGATFKLSTSNDLSAAGATIIKMTKLTGATEDTYCVDKTGTEEEIITTAITPTSAGKFTIKGLGAGTYYLHETKQPDGYNKLKDPVKIDISEAGIITVNGTALPTTSNRVEIENKTGSLLPSTGGRGTTILYVLGALLVLGSSVVLITKRRMKE